MRVFGALIAVALGVLMAAILFTDWIEIGSTRARAGVAAGALAGLAISILAGRLVGFWIDYQPRDKRAAKRFNESVKLAANSLNAMALAVIGAAVIVPLLRPEEMAVAYDVSRLIWIVGALMAHIIAHAILGLMKSEDL